MKKLVLLLISLAGFAGLSAIGFNDAKCAWNAGANQYVCKDANIYLLNGVWSVVFTTGDNKGLSAVCGKGSTGNIKFDVKKRTCKI